MKVRGTILTPFMIQNIVIGTLWLFIKENTFFHLFGFSSQFNISYHSHKSEVNCLSLQVNCLHKEFNTEQCISRKRTICNSKDVMKKKKRNNKNPQKTKQTNFESSCNYNLTKFLGPAGPKREFSQLHQLSKKWTLLLQGSF